MYKMNLSLDEVVSLCNNSKMSVFIRKFEVLIRIYILFVLSVVVKCYPQLSATQDANNDSSTVSYAPELRVISKSEWLAKTPRAPPSALNLPVPYVIIAHTATQNCCSEVQCAQIVRNIQNYHIEEKNWSDIAYNFLIGGDGNVYSGRGWSNQGSHTKNYNEISIGIAFIGDFQNYLPTKNQITSCKKLIEQGVEGGYVRKDYKLFEWKQLRISEKPGTKLFDEMKKWDHWVEKP